MRRLVYALTAHRRRPAQPVPHQPKDTAGKQAKSYKNKGSTNHTAIQPQPSTPAPISPSGHASTPAPLVLYSSCCSSHSPAPRPPLLLHPTTCQSDTRTFKERNHSPPPSSRVGGGKRGACCYTCNTEWRGKRRHARIVAWCVRCPPVRPGRCTAMSPSTARPATQLHHKGPPQQASKQASQTNHTPKHRSTLIHHSRRHRCAVQRPSAHAPPPPPLGLLAFSSCCPSHVHPMQQQVQSDIWTFKKCRKE